MKGLRLMGRRAKLAVASLLTAGIAGVNAVAYMQARAMTHFPGAGVRTKNPENLNWIEAAAVVVAGVNVPRPENTSTPAALGLAFETHRFPTSHGPVLEAWYVPGSGDRP